MSEPRPPAGGGDATLRARAEKRLQAREETASPAKGADASRLLHELEVHQIEMEFQNAELGKTRDELEAALARYTDLYDFAPVGYFTLSRDGTILSANLTGADLLDIPRVRLIGRLIGTFLSPASHPILGALLERTFADGKFESCEVTLAPAGKDERVLRFDASASPSGQECRATVLDVTRQRAAEAAFRREHLLLSQAERIADLGAWELDTGRSEFRLSPGFGKIHGILEGVLPRQAVLDLAHPKDAARIVRALEDALEDELAKDSPYDLEYRIVRRDDGLVRTVHARAVVERDPSGRALRAVGVCQDVTEAREAELALRQGEEEKRVLLQHLPLGVVVHGPDTAILYANPRAEELLGLAGEQLDGKTAIEEEWRFLREDGTSMPAGEFPVNVVVATRQPVNDFVVGIPPPSGGTTNWVLVHAYPELEDDGRLRQVVVAFADMTARKVAEEALRGLNEGLEAAVRKRTALLEAANAELEAFGHSISHDLRAPLRAIAGFSQALSEDCGDRLPPAGDDYIRRIRAGAHRMGTLIDDLLRLSRIGKSDLEMAPVDLAGPCREILAELAALAPERQVETVVPEHLLVAGDARLLRVMLEHLLGNAWKFTSKTVGARIEVGSRPEADAQVDLFVRDNGAGFDRTLVGKLFRPFQRLHTESDYPGTGIGLAIVDRIARRHGGTVRAESVQGQGATFHVLLAAAAEARP